MIIGVPKEIKAEEYRVALTPLGTETLTSKDHKVIIETNAGKDAGVSDEDYRKAGAVIVPDIKAVYRQAEMLVKVKEIRPAEYDLLREGQILFTYIHSINYKEQTRVLLKKKVIAIAYEDVMPDNGTFPLLTPMSEIAGAVGLLMGVFLSFTTKGGNGILIGGAPGVEPAKVVILGAGHAGMGAARYALGLGADVTILDVNLDRLRDIKHHYPDLKTLYSNPYNIKKILPEIDLLINAVAWRPGMMVISRNMLKLFKKTCLIMDVSCDVGGAIETAQYSFHEKPVYVVDGIRHCCIPNLPSAVARTSTYALTHATLPYVVELADKGWLTALKENHVLRRGLGFLNGHLTFKPAADLYKLPYTSPEKALAKFEAHKAKRKPNPA